MENRACEQSRSISRVSERVLEKDLVLVPERKEQKLTAEDLLSFLLVPLLELGEHVIIISRFTQAFIP